MAIGNLSRIGKKVLLTDLQSKGGSIDMLDYHTLANQYRTKALVTSSQYTMSGFAEKFDIRSAFVSVDGFKVNSQTYMNGSNNDYNGPYHVSELFFNLNSAGTYKLYVGHAATLGTGNRWCNDTSIAGAQILDIDGTVLHNIHFTNATMQQHLTAYSNTARPSPQTLSAQTFTSIGTSAISNRFVFRVGTGSSRTGASLGIDNSAFDDIPFPLSLSNDQPTISQATSGAQMFRETSTGNGISSSAIYDKTLFMRTISGLSIPKIGSIRIAYNNSTETARLADLDENGTLVLGFY